MGDEQANPRDVAVLGGGLAGLAAALRLGESGHRVTLIETRKRLGGRATSFIDPKTGEQLDNCQHVLLRCCTHLIDFYKRLGVADKISWHEVLHFFDKQGHHDIMRGGMLPAPLHFTGSFGKFKTLNLADKRAIARAMWAMLRMGRDGRVAMDDVTFEDWLKRMKQTRRSIDRFWSVVIISACNLDVDQVSARYAMQVFQDAFLAHRDAYAMGVAEVPLKELYDPAFAKIEQRGGRVMLGLSVQQLHYDPQARRITGAVLNNDQTLHADAYVSALPFDRLAKVVDDRARADDARLAMLEQFGVSPILGVHLWFDRQIMEVPHMILVDSPLQWVFGKSHDAADGVQHLHAVISAADAWVDTPADEIAQMALQELQAYLPRAAEANIVHHRIIKEKRATFRAEAGCTAYRPAVRGAIGNLMLSGDWCDTGWPATMESAVRSGYAAAAAITDQSITVPDLPDAWIIRRLSRNHSQHTHANTAQAATI